MGSYIRLHRRKSGLSQRELAEIVGVLGSRQVSKHEKFKSMPSLVAAIGYQVALKTSIADLFPGIYESVRQGVEERLSELERRLEETTPKGRKAEETAQKLIWLRERREIPFAPSKDAA